MCRRYAEAGIAAYVLTDGFSNDDDCDEGEDSCNEKTEEGSIITDTSSATVGRCTLHPVAL